ncbi:uncharacterized protein [Haliotis asinina]|uniref:uncharacterized protein n=1 Tax=Haliotis asinina TaxID=109174 RepID=UPI0035320A45
MALSSVTPESLVVDNGNTIVTLVLAIYREVNGMICWSESPSTLQKAVYLQDVESFQNGTINEEDAPQPVILLPHCMTSDPLPAMTKSPPRSVSRDKVLLGITPVTHEYYNQWARSPKLVDSSSSDPGQSTPEMTGSEPRAKTSLPRTGGRMTMSRSDLKSANPRVVTCRSTTPSVNIELPPMPSFRRSVTVVGGEKVASICADRSSSVLVPKKVLPSNQTLPMSQAVFLFKGDTFIHNAPFLGDPNRPNRSIGRYPSCVSSSQRLPSTKTPGRVTLKGEVTRSSGSVAKVQFIDFSDVKSYVNARRDVSRPKKQHKDKQFLPLSIPLGISIS